MTLQDLIQEFTEYRIPMNADVFIEADHGQNKEAAYSLVVSRTPITSDEYGDPDAMVWEYENWREIYDEDAIEEYDEDAPVTAVLITS